MLNEWCTFMKDVYKKAITRDLWQGLLDFIDEVVGTSAANSKMNDYKTEESAYPIACDEFIDFLNKSNGKS